MATSSPTIRLGRPTDDDPLARLLHDHGRAVADRVPQGRPADSARSGQPQGHDATPAAGRPKMTITSGPFDQQDDRRSPILGTWAWKSVTKFFSQRTVPPRRRRSSAGGPATPRQIGPAVVDCHGGPRPALVAGANRSRRHRRSSKSFRPVSQSSTVARSASPWAESWSDDEDAAAGHGRAAVAAAQMGTRQRSLNYPEPGAIQVPVSHHTLSASRPPGTHAASRRPGPPAWEETEDCGKKLRVVIAGSRQGFNLGGQYMEQPLAEGRLGADHFGTNCFENLRRCWVL